MAPQRSRGWCFTINNYSPLDEQDCNECKDNDSVGYLIVGKECGVEGTPHLQGVIYFRTLKSLRQVKALLPRAHLERMRARCCDAAAYCKKDGDFWEYGECPLSQQDKGAAERQRWKDAREAATTGRSRPPPILMCNIE